MRCYNQNNSATLRAPVYDDSVPADVTAHGGVPTDVAAYDGVSAAIGAHGGVPNRRYRLR